MSVGRYTESVERERVLEEELGEIRDKVFVMIRHRNTEQLDALRLRGEILAEELREVRKERSKQELALAHEFVKYRPPL